jgi:hypothetical protein
MWGTHRWLMPYIRVGIAPYVHQPSAEPVLNQTRGLVAGDGSFMLMIGLGVKVVWRRVHDRSRDHSFRTERVFL